MIRDKLLTDLDSIGWQTSLNDSTLESLVGLSRLRGDSYLLAAIATELAFDFQPITLRGLFYRVVSVGYFPSTDHRYYSKLGRLHCALRRSGIIHYEWIVDNLRSTLKPSSWSGLPDFAATTRDAYRKNFWLSLPDYVHVFVEKDAMSGVVQPVTLDLDVPLSPVRGYTSDTFAHDVGSRWLNIDKPIHCYYLGDFDPSGFDRERSLREKLEEHSGRAFNDDCNGYRPEEFNTWTLLALNADDFDKHSLITLHPKQSDPRTKKFIERYGHRCAEVDALDPNTIRQRVHDAISAHIPAGEWERLQEVEDIERQSWESTVGSLVTT